MTPSVPARYCIFRKKIKYKHTLKRNDRRIMVPHELVKKEINEIIRAETRCIAVCGADDSKKGEKLVVIYADQTIDPQNIFKALRGRSLPNLRIPRPENFYYIQEIPMPGSGNLDFTELKKLAAELAVERNNV